MRRSRAPSQLQFQGKPGRGTKSQRTHVGRPESYAPQSVRYLNELRALDVLFRDGAMSRADLARTLGLNRSTTGSIISSLLAESLVVERRRAKSVEPRAQTGRPGIDVELNPEGALFIGAEIEVDELTAVVIDLTGRLIRRVAVVFPAGRLPPSAVRRNSPRWCARWLNMGETRTRSEASPLRFPRLSKPGWRGSACC